ncbi:MAG TPA: ImmA/IrrE family metallo-endopeptidase [Anaerolineae bacterium]|nr:ImmA/IrrE family metallo-endopeptidase [Anaerolineae bacterium]
MPKVNPDILCWARETAGLTLEETSHKLGIREARGVSSVERLAALETGKKEPTRPMLMKMAKRYRRPLLVFYMAEPPRKGNRGQDFRTLPEGYSETSNALVDTLIRNIQVRQSIIRSALEDEEEAEPLSFVGSMNISDGVNSLVESIKETINIDLGKFRSQHSLEDAFKYLRSKVETAGVFVLLIGDLGSHHTAFDLEVFRGFALSDEVAPFIIINDRDSRAAWSFTLIHELVHVWLGQTGISGTNSEKDIEQFCNKVASEFLLPEADMVYLNLENVFDFEEMKTLISDFANARNLSSSMVAYNLYLKGKISKDSWLQLNSAYRSLWQEARAKKRKKAREEKGGPTYYVVRKHRLGENLIAFVQRMMAGGTLTTSKASKVLGVAPKNVHKLFKTNIHAAKAGKIS